ncbi:MAG: phosphoadenosine phosphosulfate reductase family protein [Candidatus Gottesmanbacteria bacterium]
MPMKLQEKINKSKDIIKEAADRYKNKNLTIAWTGGKDSTIMLHMVKSVFGKIPFPVMFNDSTLEFPEIYEFIDKLVKDWNLNIIRVVHLKEDLEQFHRTRDMEKKKELSRIMKINAIRWATKKYHVAAYMAAIRWDEHESRSKETYFSKRETHERVHPVLHFTEQDIWSYTKRFKVPYVSLYDKGYRSLGEAPFTKPAKKGEGERSGREYDKEKVMKQLRDLGYW